MLGNGDVLKAKKVVITTGTFLRGIINIGLDTKAAGRMGDKPAIGLAKTIEDIGFRMGRMRTGKTFGSTATCYLVLLPSVATQCSYLVVLPNTAT